MEAWGSSGQHPWSEESCKSVLGASSVRGGSLVWGVMVRAVCISVWMLLA